VDGFASQAMVRRADLPAAQIAVDIFVFFFFGRHRRRRSIHGLRLCGHAGSMQLVSGPGSATASANTA